MPKGIYQKTEIQKKRIGETLKNLYCDKTKHPCFGKSKSEETKLRISIAHKGKKLSPEQAKKVAEMGRKFWSNPENQKKYGFKGKREKNPNWQGGIYPLAMLIRTSDKYYNWRFFILKRNDFQCIDCGSKLQIEADHIIPFSFLLKKNNITTLEEAMNCKELWDVNNGRTLCRKCHQKTPTWGRPKQKK